DVPRVDLSEMADIEKWEEYKKFMVSNSEWLQSQELEHITIKARDGIILHADYFPAEGDGSKLVICNHGYTGTGIIQTEQNKIFRHANYDPIEYTMKRGQYWKYKPGTSYESISLTYQPITITKDTPEMPDIPYKSYWYSNGVAAQPLYLTVMHRPEDNGLNFNFEYRIDAVTDKEMEYFYYYLCRVLFRGIEDETRTIGEILDMI
ncbi:MAG: hypothetical protein PUB89_03885, partial [Oscillospiraceae bacterium]|nr:hypothetical protein [Oscillospiraceae bacterium]